MPKKKKTKRKRKTSARNSFRLVVGALTLAWSIALYTFISNKTSSDVAFYILTIVLVILAVIGFILWKKDFVYQKVKGKLE